MITTATETFTAEDIAKEVQKLWKFWTRSENWKIVYNDGNFDVEDYEDYVPNWLHIQLVNKDDEDDCLPLELEIEDLDRNKVLVISTYLYQLFKCWEQIRTLSKVLTVA